MKRLFTLILLAILPLLTFAHEIFVVETGQIIQSDTYPTVKKTELRESDRITVTYTFDSILIVRDNANPNIVCFQPDGFGLIHLDEHAMTPYKMDQFLLSQKQTGELETYTTSSVEYSLEYFPSYDDFIDFDSLPTAAKPIKIINKFLPETPVLQDYKQKFRGCELLRISLFPIQYNSQAKKVRVNKEISYTISKTISTENHNDSTLSELLSPIASDKKWNVNLGPEPFAADANKTYLIITVPQLQLAAERLMSWKKACGYSTCIHVLPEAATVDNVKYAIKVTRIQHPDLYYILLMGDETQIPAIERKSPLAVSQNAFDYFTDIPYAYLDGDNDYIPDVCIGRLPFGRLSEMNDVLDKTIAYEKYPSGGMNESRATFISFFQDDLLDGTADNGFVYNTERSIKYANNFYDKISRIYSKNENSTPTFWPKSYGGGILDEYLRNESMWTGNKTNIIQRLNNGSHLVLHRDHGNIDGWENPEFRTADLQNLDNQILPIIINLDCDVGTYYKPANFSKVLLGLPYRGCAATIGATNPTNTYRNDALMIGMINAIWPNPGIRHQGKAFINIGSNEYQEVYSIGEMLNQALLQMEETCYAPGYPILGNNSQLPSLNRKTRELYHCLGDPSLPIYWNSGGELSKIAKREDFISCVTVSADRDVTIALYDSITDKPMRVFGSQYRYATSHPEKVRVTIFKPGCNPTVLPSTLDSSNYPGIIGDINANSLNLKLITDNEKNETEGYTIMVNYGDGTNSIITTESDRTDYCVDISEKPGIEPGAFFIVTLRQGNQIIQTQKILR